MKENYDVIIVGTGAAGLYCALNLPERTNILMITKQEADQSDSFLAQGGICMLRGEDDYDDYFEDTIRHLQTACTQLQERLPPGTQTDGGQRRQRCVQPQI